MGRKNTTKEFRTFVKGIITEASPLTFPENASIDEENFVLNRTGSRQRRLGMDYENLYTGVSTTFNSASMESLAISTYRWDNVDNDPSLSFAVIQIGYKIFFADAFESAISSNLKNGGSSVDLASSGTRQFQMTAINGVLIVTTGETDPFYLSYDALTDTITKTDISIKVRDLWGVDDGLEVDEQPATLSDNHNYNLYNQGWLDANINLVKYPSNADIQYLGKDSNETFAAATLAKQFFGTTSAPRGKYIIDAFARGTSRGDESGVATVPVDTENGFISSACSYSGRMFYSGIISDVTSGDSRSPDYTGFIFFTKTMDNLEDLERCYQDADPTSEHVTDLIDTDGGYVTIPEASIIYKIIPYSGNILVFADNGVWRIFSTEKGFTATDQEIEQITNIGSVNASSIVIAEDVVYYWSVGGIYAIQPEEVSGSLIVNNISQHTVQSLFTGIKSVGRKNSIGTYDPINKKVSWLYNTEDSYLGTTFKNKYNRELILDTLMGAFYKNKIEDLELTSPYVASYMTVHDFLTLEDVQNVVVGGDQVQEDGIDVTVTQSMPATTNNTVTKYLTLIPTSTYSFTFSYYKDSDFLDWESADAAGVSFLSYLNTGYEIYGDTTSKKQVPYIFFHFERTEDGYDTSGTGVDYTNPSSCMVQAQWGWSNSTNSGRWGNPFQAYRLKRHYIPSGSTDTFDYGFDVVTTKNKLRGKGKAVSLYIYSEDEKDLRLLGWAASAAGTTVP